MPSRRADGELVGQMSLEDALPEWSRAWQRSDVEMCADHLLAARIATEEAEDALARALAVASGHDQVSFRDLTVWSGLRATRVRALLARGHQMARRAAR